MTRITENKIEAFTIELLVQLGYEYIYAPDLIPSSGGVPEGRGGHYSQVLLLNKLQNAVKKINPSIPADAQSEAIKEIQRIASPDLLANNETFHRLLTEGIPVQKRVDGDDSNDRVWLVDFKNPHNNDFVVANQFTIIENDSNQRPDVILFVNGIPLVVIELKNAADENTTLNSVYKRVETYKAMIPSLFTYNVLIVISDGLEAKAGSISAGLSHFIAWKSAGGKAEASHQVNQLETLIIGMLNKVTLLDLIHSPTLEGWPKGGVVQSPPLEGCPKGGVVHSPAPYRNSKNYFSLPYNPNLRERARALRKAGYHSEVLFWKEVKNKQFKGYDFDRQKIIGNYIVDFYCGNCQVVIEIDGSSHDDKQEYDAERDAFLESLGLTVIHIAAKDVLKNLSSTMEWLYEHEAFLPEKAKIKNNNR